MDPELQNIQTVHCKLLTDIGQTLQDASGRSDTEPRDGNCEVLTDFGRNIQDTSRRSDTEPTDRTL